MMQTQPHPQFLQPLSPYYNIIDPYLDEACFYNPDMNAQMGDCDFSSSLTTTEESSDVSSILHFPTIYPDEFPNLPVYGDDVQAMFPLEHYSPNLEMVPILNDTFLIDEIEDVFGLMEGSESSPSQQYLIEEEYEGSLSSSLMKYEETPSLILPREDMEVDNQLSIPHLLKAYGEAVENEQAELAKVISRRIREKGSPIGETLERLGYYLFQTLENQGDYLMQESNKNYEAAFRAFYEIFPYGRFAHLTANLAILEAMPEDAETIHIVDFDMGEGVQWPPLIEAIGRQRRTVKLTSIKYEEQDCGSIPPQWRFDETKRRLYNHAQSFGINLKVEEMGMGDLVKEIMKTKEIGVGREWLAFNCMLGLPHMRKGRSRRHVKEFLRVSKELINISNGSYSNKGILTFGAGDGVEKRMKNCCGFGSFLDGFLLHCLALFESMEWNFPSHLTEARIVMECLFVAPYVSSLACFGKWDEITKEGCGLQLGEGLEGWRFSEDNLLQAKEMVKEGESLYGVRVEVEENVMVLEWKGTALVRVSTWR